MMQINLVTTRGESHRIDRLNRRFIVKFPGPLLMNFIRGLVKVQRFVVKGSPTAKHGLNLVWSKEVTFFLQRGEFRAMLVVEPTSGLWTHASNNVEGPFCTYPYYRLTPTLSNRTPFTKSVHKGSA